jgi:hypothetical protein
VACAALVTGNPVPTSPSACLCVFDIDRTLTGKQGEESNCTNDLLIPGVFDAGYIGGTLLLSEFTTHVYQTFCSECYLGIISAGNASGPGSMERMVLHKVLSSFGKLPTSEWSPAGCNNVTSPLVTSCPDTEKWGSMPAVVSWYEQHENVSIDPSEVFFYDDKAINVNAFRQGKFNNAKQISCGDRDFMWGSDLGHCGARVEEVKRFSGVQLCSDTVLV